jgi:hypothetical protein
MAAPPARDGTTHARVCPVEGGLHLPDGFAIGIEVELQ